MSFTAERLSVDLGQNRILSDISFALPRHGLTGIIGANGSGKSTLLRALGGLIPSSGGTVLHEGIAIDGLSPRLRARRIAMLPQSSLPPPGLSLRQLVARGRTPWLRPFLPMSARDREIVAAAMARGGVADLADRPLESLSGGQRQRAWIAMVLAQDCPTLLLDEPLNHLDLPYQAGLVAMLRALAPDHAVVMVLHDLTIASRLCDHMIALRSGRLVAAGPSAGVLRPQVLAETFGIGFTVAEIAEAPGAAPRPVILPAGL